VSDFLTRMREASCARVERARARRTDAQLEATVAAMPPPPRLDFHAGGFDVIAEVKRRAPSGGALVLDDDVAVRADTYALGGAAAISVLTEPTEFAGHMDDLTSASTAVPLPVMRKDFLVDPYQILEARAHGAAGALVIARMVDGTRIRSLVDAAADVGLFLLIEIFGMDDLNEGLRAVAHAQTREVQTLLGVNTRDLTTLHVDATRLARLAPQLPSDTRRVAESGMRTPEDIERAVGLGYQVALVGTSLMRADDPAAFTAELIRTGRDAIQRGTPTETVLPAGTQNTVES